MKAEGEKIRCNVIGMLIVTSIDEYYRSSSTYLCVFYTKQRRVIKLLDGKNPLQKKTMSALLIVYFFFMHFFLIMLMYMYFMHTEAELFNLYYSSVPILKNSMKLKLQGLQKRDNFKKG